jgi:hypothetical protein
MSYAHPELDVLPWPQDGHAGRLPAYSPGHGPYAFRRDDSVRRPGSVTAAAVLAFILGGLGSFGYLLALAFLAAASAKWTTPMLVVAGAVLLVGLSPSVMFVWGGVSAVRGRGRKLLATTSWIYLTLCLLGLVGQLVSSDIAGAVSTIVQMVFVMAILALIQSRSSIEFFDARSRRSS